MGIWSGKGAVALGLFVVPLVSSCEYKAPIGDGSKCFPAETQKWLTKSAPLAAGVAGNPIAPTAEGVTLYIDRSASMVGYVRGSTLNERPYQDLLSVLPNVSREVSPKFTLRAFGKAIGEPLSGGAATAQAASFFSCGEKAAVTPCDNQETRLDAVFERIANNPKEVSVIISDLWLSNSDLQTSGMTALQPTLANILKSGRSISIYGIEAPFSGTIYDLPTSGGKLSKVNYQAGYHPLYVIIVGPKADLVRMDAELGRSGSNFLAQGVTSGSIKHSFFSLSPQSIEPNPVDRFELAPNPNIVQSAFMETPGVAIQQFEVLKASGLSTTRTAAALIWSAPRPEMFARNAVWSGPMDTSMKVWMRLGKGACEPADWLPPATTTKGWSKGANGQISVSIDPAAMPELFPSKGTYLIAPVVVRTTLTSPNPQNAWMYGGWNLSPNNAAQMALNRPKVFPTMNLSEIARLLESSLAKAAEQQPTELAGRPILIKMK
jgi:hypothetical protein